MRKYRVLSLDGGGIRGIISVVLLQRLCQEPGMKKWLNRVQLVAGTSTGGLIALGIAKGVPLARLRDLYVHDGPEVFHDTAFDDAKDLGKLFGADYSVKGLRKHLKRILGSRTTLGELENCHVLVTAFDLDNSDDPLRKAGSARTWKPKVFHNYKGKNSDVDVVAWKAGLYTCAAPTYFPSVDGYIDGGVYAPNPSMCALAQTQDRRYQPHPKLDEVRLLSLGTGTTLQWIAGASKDWGYAQWGPRLLPLLLDGTTGIADYQCQQMLRDRYHRLAPSFPPDKKIDMDAVDQIQWMVDFATKQVDLTETVDWIKTYW